MKASILVSLLLLASQCLIFTNQTYAQVYYQRDDNGRLLEVGFIKAPAHVQAQAQAALAERKRSPVLVDPHNGGWSVYDNASGSAAISMFSDPKRGDGVIQLAGDGHGDGYRLGAADGGPWYDTENQIFQWSMKYSEFFTIYITVETNDGIYYMVYTPVEGHHITHSSIVNYGLGKSARNGQWQTFTRDLLYDLDYARPTIELIAILGFQIRGSGLLQNVKALPSFPAGLDADRDGITDNQEIQHYETNPYRADSDGDAIADGDELNYWGDSWQDDSDGDLLPDLRDPDSDNDGLVDGAEIAAGSDPRDRLSVAQQLVYEDGSGAARWDMYDNSPVGASIRSVTDAGRAGQVVRLRGSAISNGFRLRYPDQHWWNNQRHKSLRWSMRSNEDFWIYIPVLTDAGLRYLSYTSKATDTLGSGEYIQFGLGADAKSGAWRTFTRDLEQDLKRAQPDRELLAVQGFMVRGSLYIDDIHSLDDFPTDLDTDADGIEDQLERERYGSNPSVGDSDGDGIGDGDELDYWGKRWNDDIDGDGVINLLDPDADNDGLLDGAELEQGTDPGDPNSAGNYLSYEDAEDSNTLGWDVYDASPGGNSVRNVANPDGDGRVIKLSGHGLANGYRLRRHNGQWWQNKDHTRLSWDMKYSEFFTVYIAVQTSQGFRYLYYTPVQKSDLGDGKYIQFGLGTELRNGQWHSVERDLAADLEQAQPGNRLLSIEGFLIRGSGYVDNIEAGED